jgi:hypothetical protein
MTWEKMKQQNAGTVGCGENMVRNASKKNKTWRTAT